MSGMPVGGCTTWRSAVPLMPFGALALIVASPAATPVATPLALTVATAVAFDDQVNVTPAIGWLDASSALAVKVCVAPVAIVALAGATITLVTSGGGGVSPASLHAPKVLAAGAAQVPAALRASDKPTGSLPTSRTPMS